MKQKYYRWYSGGFYVEVQAESEEQARQLVNARKLITAHDAYRDADNRSPIFICGNANYDQPAEVYED